MFLAVGGRIPMVQQKQSLFLKETLFVLIFSLSENPMITKQRLWTSSLQLAPMD
jgi:hypothetical protein